MANTAITSNRAVPGKNTALEYKYAPLQIKKEKKEGKKSSLLTDIRKENQQPLTLIFIAPFVFILFFFFILEQLCFVMTALATRAL